jgi:Calcineurin-like phosphoesterase.
MCRVLFSPFATQEDGADEQTIWILWTITLSVMLLVFAQDELNGYHCRSDNAGFTIHLRKTKSRRKSSITDDDLDMDSSRNRCKSGKRQSVTRMVFRRTNQLEVPRDTLPMVPWLSLFAAHSVLDIFISLKVFMGRVDARLMHPALQGQKQSGAFQGQNESKAKDDSSTIKGLQEKYPGCIYDYSIRGKNKDFWFDFMADCGDGFNSSYQVARFLAQRQIKVIRDGKEHQLPRGEVLVIGGDLAYPAPSEASYEKRFFRTFEDAMAPPPSFRRNKIATNKLDICVDGWDEKLCFTGGTVSQHSHDEYLGPCTFIVPGNHDWYDGLATYSRFILHRDFLGGWLMPQQRSYFAIKLPKGWWIFGMDCALSADIDIEQFKFFADIADNAVGQTDAVILVNHEPHWVTDFDSGKKGETLSERNITELTEIHLRGKVRCRLAGDLHHYTRHVPVSSRKKSHLQRRVRSYSLDRISKKKTPGDFKRKRENLEPFTEENKPQLIVSGGGGAFLHGTNTFDRHIKVGPKGIEYTRVTAYPNEATSTCLGWLNMYQFRWRGWRCDLIFAVTYLGIGKYVFSFFAFNHLTVPRFHRCHIFVYFQFLASSLCAVYTVSQHEIYASLHFQGPEISLQMFTITIDDYDKFNPHHEFHLLFVWVARMVVSLVLRMISSEWYSLICFLGVLFMMLALQSPEHHLKPVQRYILAFGRKLCFHFLSYFIRSKHSPDSIY